MAGRDGFGEIRNYMYFYGGDRLVYGTCQASRKKWDVFKL